MRKGKEGGIKDGREVRPCSFNSFSFLFPPIYLPIYFPFASSPSFFPFFLSRFPYASFSCSLTAHVFLLIVLFSMFSILYIIFSPFASLHLFFPHFFFVHVPSRFQHIYPFYFSPFNLLLCFPFHLSSFIFSPFHFPCLFTLSSSRCLIPFLSLSLKWPQAHLPINSMMEGFL